MRKKDDRIALDRICYGDSDDDECDVIVKMMSCPRRLEAVEKSIDAKVILLNKIPKQHPEFRKLISSQEEEAKQIINLDSELILKLLNNKIWVKFSNVCLVVNHPNYDKN